MATNPYVNKVVYGNQTVMDISDTTASASDVASGEVFYTGSGQRSVGTADYYSPTDTAETTIDDADYFPFYDTSATAKRKTLWSNIKSVLKTYFDKICSTASSSLLKDTVGWTGKNLFDHTFTSQTINTVVFTVGSDKSIKANGTASAKVETLIFNKVIPAGAYILSKGIANANYGVSLQAYNGNTWVKNLAASYGTDEVSFTVDYDGYDSVHGVLIVNNGTSLSNVTIYPMLRKASITDSTFEPYHESVKQTLRDAEVIEGKNLVGITSLPTGDNKNFAHSFKLPSGVRTITISAKSTGTGQLNWKVFDGSGNTILADQAVIYDGQTSGSRTATLSADGYVLCYATNDSYAGNFSEIQVEEGSTVTSYEPYYIPLKDSKFDRAEQRVLGAKNLLENKAVTVTRSDVVYTVNADKSISLSGTSSAANSVELNTITGAEFKAMGNSLILSGGVSAQIYLAVRDSSWNLLAKSEGGDVVLDTSTLVDATSYIVCLAISNGQNTSGKIAYPMLRLASDPDDTYVPYAMTNKELTDGLAGKQDALTLPLSTSNGGTGNATGYIRTGKKSGSNASTGTTIEGNNNTATAQYAHAEGSSNNATAASAHVEGTNNYATGNSSHAEGSYNRADGAQSHAQGSRCEADGDYSHTGGYYLNAGYQSQTVVGEYNDNKASTLFEVGNGTSTNARSNALEVYLDGHINVNGGIQKNGLDALETIVATSYVNNGTVTFSGVDDTVGGTHMYSVGFNVTSSSTQKAPYAELQSISGEGTSSMTLTYKTNADNGSSSNKNASLIRKIF